MPIEQLRAGDRVLARDDATGELGYREVTAAFSKGVRPIAAVLVVHGDHTELIETTEEHPFWVRDRGWVAALELQRGDEVFTSRGGWVRIGGATLTSRSAMVYNITVREWHSYFVGDRGVWVHNDPNDGRAFGAADVPRIAGEPEILWGVSPDEIAQAFQSAGYGAAVVDSVKGSKRAKIVRIDRHPEIMQIQVHPGGGRHVGPYVKISTSTRGTIRVVDDAFVGKVNGPVVKVGCE